LLDSGRAVPIGFATPLAGTLLVASDGLWKYVQRKRIAAIVLEPELDAATRHLIEAARLQSRDLQDDVSVILCRNHSSTSPSAT
jgi:serine/threonine protein phosphatase PrpC